MDAAELSKTQSQEQIQELVLEQIAVSDLGIERGQAVNWGKMESQYVDKDTGLPIAPKTVKAMLKRSLEDQVMWREAIVSLRKSMD